MSKGVRSAALVLVVCVMTSCMAAGKSSASPSGAKAGAKGPFVPAQAQISAGRCQPGSTTEGLHELAFKMTSTTTGWALGRCSLAGPFNFPNGTTVNCDPVPPNWMGTMHTTDGGVTWTDVSPPNVANRTWHRVQYFLDDDHAWVGEVSRNADACVSQVTVFMTSDGGRTWTQRGTVPLKTKQPTDEAFDIGGSVDNMDFVDTQHGWLLVASPPSNPDPSNFQVATALYATVDGGMHWRLVATDPGKSAITAAGCSTSYYQPASDVKFDSATAGWLELSCQSGWIIVTTRDGGSTWTARPFPPCGCMVWRPEFFDANHAVVTGVQQSPVLLSTSDGGATWRQRSVPAAAMTEFSFVNPEHGWMVGIAQLPTTYETVVYRTLDGGQTWTQLGKPGFATVASNARAFFPISSVDFVDESTGFVVLGGESGTNGQTDPTAPELQLLGTTDGGRTWKVLVKEVPAAPCTVGYSQLGFGNGGLMPVKMISPTVGWGRGGLRTTDGGVHWKDVSSSALREGQATTLYPPDYAEAYLDGDHAWQAAVYGAGSTCADHVSVFGTSDAGRTWTKSGPIPLHLAAGTRAASLQIGFTSELAGWLWMPQGVPSADGFMGSISQADLFTTADGGQTWRHVTQLRNSDLKGVSAPADSQNCTPTLQQIEFSSPSVAWLSLGCAVPSVLVSRDGGSTWKAAPIPVGSSGCPCYFDLPHFGDPDHGMVVVSGEGGLTASTQLLSTADGGTTWRASAAPGTGFVLVLDWVNPDDLFALVTPPGWTKLSKSGFELYRSTDGGRSWTLVQHDVPATWPPGFMQFVDLKHGFEANINADGQLLTTEDGGVTWKVVTPAIGG
ncbi:MAG TPA: hypothetical protein VFL27_06510 [Candidatus Dormibacteraeota bacterium]|nr:hypothetical protein [Candidatus Dormibacteraeota bacterium]